MAIRMSGMISGMDTDSLISELVAARQKKVDAKKKDQTKLTWKQDAWKDLNSKLKKLQSKYISNMRFASSYAKKTTKVSNSSVANVITGDKAQNSVQSLEVSKLAKTAYLTGGKIQADGELTALSKLSDIDPSIGEDFNGSFKITAGGKEVSVDVTSETSISDVLNKLKDAGLNASFDEKQGRFFVSAKESGADANFSITANDENGTKALETLGLAFDPDSADEKSSDVSKAHFTKGQDAEIYLNGALFTNKNNVFEVNGLTITALAETKDGEKVTLTTEQDTDGIYDMVKGFLKEYNEIINEMDKLYNAKSAKGYEPLTNEEKSAMSEKEAEDYEKKIKDALLRRDENLGSVISGLTETMSSQLEINGKKMTLSDFGINTLSYFSAADNEKHAYYIDGDPDSDSTSGNADKLKAMISNDPDTVISFFTKLSQDVYAKMNDMSKSVDGYRSFGSFFDDKRMETDAKSYTSKIAEMEQKLNDYEDKWYKKFSKMETAMAKMQEKTTALSGLFGGN